VYGKVDWVYELAREEKHK